MGIFLNFSLKKKIKNTIGGNLENWKKDRHIVTGNTFYGSYAPYPKNLVIWYLFDRVSDMKDAEADGYNDHLIVSTIENLTKNGFPEMKFIKGATEINEVRFSNSLKNQIQSNQIHVIFQSSRNLKVLIGFSSKEDVQIEAHGDYRVYFQ